MPGEGASWGLSGRAIIPHRTGGYLTKGANKRPKGKNTLLAFGTCPLPSASSA